MCYNFGCLGYLLFHVEVLLLQGLIYRESHLDSIEALHMAGKVFFINFIHLCTT